MGIDVPSMALLSAAKRIGVDFTSTAVIGRQNFAGDRVEAGLNRMFEMLGDDDFLKLRLYALHEAKFTFVG
jgi:hypothetical protein